MERQPKRLYTKGEEIFNAVSHIAGGAFGVAALVLGLVFAVRSGDGFAIAAMAIYGGSLIILYTASSIYHFLRPNRAKQVFQVFDHCTIFVLIAGSYTPFCLIALRESGAWGWALFGVIWFLAAAGILLNAVNMHNKVIKRVSMTAYIGMGWCAVVAIVPLLRVLALPGFMLLLAGGISYTVGAVFYAFGKKKKYIHSVWHLFVLLGSVLQFFAIFFYVLLA
jgi:hemolysin III